MLVFMYTRNNYGFVLCSPRVSLLPFVGCVVVSNNKVEASISIGISSMLDNEMPKLFCFI